MATILRNYGVARENYYFKEEQEAETQQLYKRLKEQGVIKDAPQGAKQLAGLSEGGKREQSIDVLAEILKHEVRIDSPHAATQRESVRRVLSHPPSLQEIQRYNLAGADSRSVARYRSWRPRPPSYSPYPPGDTLQIPVHKSKVSPEAAEAAQRQFMLGLRALSYGSALGIVGFGGAVVLSARAMEIHSLDDLKVRIPVLLAPVREYVQQWAAMGSLAGGSGEGQNGRASQGQVLSGKASLERQ